MITLPETSAHPDKLRLPQGATIVLDNRQGGAEAVCSDTPLYESRDVAGGNDVPPKIYEMIRMYEYGNSSFGQKCLNFYRQGKFMEDYEDDAPWEGTFSRYFPTYHDLNIRQLRGYFTWRTQVRKGTYLPVSTSLAYIYLYELLNGIGTTSVEESLWKMQEFETEFLDTEIGDPHMKHNLHRWMLELAIVHQLPKKTVLQYIEPYHLQLDRDLETLRQPESRTDEEIFSALSHFAERKIESSPVFKKDEAAGKHLFAEIWKHTLATFSLDDKDLFTACFGPLKAYHWYPLANAVYLEQRKLDDTTYELNSCHRYLFTDGHWLEEKYGELYFHRNRIKALLHVTDLKLRRYFGTGHHLRGNDEEAWAIPFVETVIEADRQAKIEAARPKVSINLDNLSQIRQDAAVTRESLLTDEDRAEATNVPAPAEVVVKEPVAECDRGGDDDNDYNNNNDNDNDYNFDYNHDNNDDAGKCTVNLDAIHRQILLTLLGGGTADDLLRTHRLMPSVVTDTLNEAFYDEIGDSILNCDGERISLVEDYVDDVKGMIAPCPCESEIPSS